MKYSDVLIHPLAKHHNILTPLSPTISPCSSASFLSSFRLDTPATAVTVSRSSSRATRSTYRHDLVLNQIYIDHPEVAEGLVQKASEILHGKRNSPGLTEDMAKAASRGIRSLQYDADEASVREVYQYYDVLPPLMLLPKGIARACDIPFDPTAFPKAPLAPPLAQTKSDQHYSFKQECFTPEQQYKQTSRILRNYSTPSTSGHWPFLTVEFKSQAKGGTIWVAENQAAASGAQMVSSMVHLLSMTDEQHEQVESITFSCTIDAKNVSFWVHFCEDKGQDQPGGRSFYSYEIEQYTTLKPDNIIACRNAFRNILGWSIKERLPAIVAVLDQIKIDYLDVQAKGERVRPPTPQHHSSSKRSSVSSTT